MLLFRFHSWRNEQSALRLDLFLIGMLFFAQWSFVNAMMNNNSLNFSWPTRVVSSKLKDCFSLQYDASVEEAVVGAMALQSYV